MAWVKFVREDVEIEVEDGISVLEAEIQAGLRPDAPCGGLGKCGKCLVKINGEVVKAHPASVLPESPPPVPISHPPPLSQYPHAQT